MIYDPETKKASGVRVIDAETKESMVLRLSSFPYVPLRVCFYFNIITSKSEYFPNGMGNASGELGHASWTTTSKWELDEFDGFTISTIPEDDSMEFISHDLEISVGTPTVRIS